MVVCSLQLFPAQGGAVPRTALHLGELPVLSLVGAAEGHEGNGRVFRPHGRRPDQKTCLCTPPAGDDSHVQRQAGEETLLIHGVSSDR